MIHGQVLAGPVCPVERPGQTGGEPKPVAGSIDFIKGGRRVGEARAIEIDRDNGIR